MQRFICLIIGYAFGLFETAYFIGKFHHKDIRSLGSGNAGSTNITRNFGTLAGILNLCGDVGKCVLAILAVQALFANSGREILPLLKLYAGLGCILGHDFPFYLNFRGGKGVATSAALLLMIDWRVLLVGLTLFVLIFLKTRYVSLGALCGAALAVLLGILFALLGFYGMERGARFEMCILFVLVYALMAWQHRENIARLRSGTERPLHFSKSGEENS